jgi:hypothetical protein
MANSCQSPATGYKSAAKSGKTGIIVETIQQESYKTENVILV